MKVYPFLAAGILSIAASLIASLSIHSTVEAGVPTTPTATPTHVPVSEIVDSLDASPADMAVDEERGLVYVSLPGAHKIVVLDLETLDEVGAFLLGGKGPQGLDLSLDGSRLFAALGQAGAVASID